MKHLVLHNCFRSSITVANLLRFVNYVLHVTGIRRVLEIQNPFWKGNLLKAMFRSILIPVLTKAFYSFLRRWINYLKIRSAWHLKLKPPFLGEILWFRRYDVDIHEDDEAQRCINIARLPWCLLPCCIVCIHNEYRDRHSWLVLMLSIRQC